MRRPAIDVDVEHLVNEHGIDRKILTVHPSTRRDQKRNLALFYEMQHAADHAQRKVDHDHG